MKKTRMMHLLTAFALLIAVTACSRGEKCLVAQPQEYVGVYKGLLYASSEGEELVANAPQKVYVEAVGERIVAIRMQHLAIPTTSVSELNLAQTEILKRRDEVIYLLGGIQQAADFRAELLEGSIAGEEINLKLNLDVPLSRTSVSSRGLSLSFKGQKMEHDKSSEAEFKSIRLKNKAGEAIQIAHITIDHEANTVELDLLNVSDEELKELVAEVEVSQGATVSLASGSLIDLSAPVSLRIQSEDEVVSRSYTLTVRQQRFETHFDFEKLTGKYENNKLEQKGMIPTQQGAWAWGSSDGGVKSLISLGRAERFGVVGTSDAYKGDSAMQIETLDTKGAKPFFSFPATPKVTSGSLFLGEFKLSTTQPLNSTKFGVVVAKKPLVVKGHYKYKSGDTYYHCPNPSPKTSHLVEEVPGQKDQGMLAAVLYEVSNPEEESLTGLDIYTSDKIVAMKQLVVSDQASYEAFELELDYKQAYDSTKTYKLAVIFSASKEGDKFSGAPGSTLWIDEVKIISE